MWANMWVRSQRHYTEADMTDIAKWRSSIDEIDEKLLKLVNERAACAVEIGKIKKEQGIDIYNPDRERSILQHIRSVNKGPLDDDAVERVFGIIIEVCRKSEET